MYCSICGSQLRDGDSICPMCGGTVQQVSGSDFFYRPNSLDGSKIKETNPISEQDPVQHFSPGNSVESTGYVAQTTGRAPEGETGNEAGVSEIQEGYNGQEQPELNYMNNSQQNINYNYQNNYNYKENHPTDSYVPQYEKREYSIPGILTGIAFLTLAIFGFVQIIRWGSSFSKTKITMTSDNSFPVICIYAVFILYLAYVIGLFCVSIGHFTLKRRLMKDGADTVMGGYCGAVVVIIILLIVSTKGNISFLFSDGRMVALFIAVALKMAAFVLFRRKYADIYGGNTIGESYTHPFLLELLSVIVLAAVAVSTKSGIEISVVSGSFSSNVAMEIVLILAFFFSGRFLHSEEMAGRIGNQRDAFRDFLKF